MTNTNLLNEHIDKCGLKKAHIANALGISRAALWKKINNITAFNQYEIDGMCDVLGIKSLEEKEAIFFAK